MLDCFSPPKDLADFCERDLSQDWISARAVLSGRPAYGALRPLVEAEFGPDSLPPAASILPYNAHPPGTILLTLPLGFLDYKAAWVAWTFFSVASLLASVFIILRELTGKISGDCLFPLLAFIATSHPFQETIHHGQLNGVLLLPITIAWAALARRPGVAGTMIGLAAAIKLFPCLLILPLIGRRSWRAAGAAIACIALLSAAAVVAVGYQGCRSYVLDVAPSIGADHGSAWGNHSLVGLYHKLFGDVPGKFRPLYRDATLERAATLASVALACGLAIWGGSFERRTGPARASASFLYTDVALVILSPVSWNHYFILLIPPLAWLYSAARHPAPRMGVLALAAILWLPRWTIWRFAAPGSVHDGKFDLVGPLATATGLATQTYTVVILYFLIVSLSFSWGGGADLPGPGPIRRSARPAH